MPARCSHCPADGSHPCGSPTQQLVAICRSHECGHDSRWPRLYQLSTSGLLLGLDVVGVVLILLGCVLMIPWMLHPACRWLAVWLESWFGVASHLASKQLLRHVGRTSMTIGVLFVALATSIGMAGNVLDNVRNVQNWYEKTIVGDYFVLAPVCQILLRAQPLTCQMKLKMGCPNGRCVASAFDAVGQRPVGR